MSKLTSPKEFFGAVPGSDRTIIRWDKICDYFDITPLQFFDSEAVNPQLLRKAMDGMRKLKDEDLILLIGLISRLQSEN